jgi:hypothetical protein
VGVACEFAYADASWPGNFPGDSDRAGGAGPVRRGNRPDHAPEEGHDLSGFQVVLTAEGGRCPIVAQAVSGKDGRFSLGRLPVGIYHYYVLPPPPGWSFKFPNHGDTRVIAGRENHLPFLAFPGNNDKIVQPPSCPGGPGANPPDPQASPKPGLAYTGASLVVPGIAGLLALLAGAVTVFVTRRRRPTD